MSDSDVDLLPNNVFTFPNENTTVSARGPNINASINGLSFRNNIMTTTMHMSRNYERQKYLEQSSDQRNMYYRRDTSPPMSLHSASSFRPRNYQHMYPSMYYPRGMSSQRSMINGRSGSPLSMRSIDSNATVSAADIVMALENIKIFNKFEQRAIKDACNRYRKRSRHRKIEKRRNLRLIMKSHRRRSGYDSGELGSDSSISSDDGRSTRTTQTCVYRDNMSSCRSTKTDFSDFRRTVKEGSLYKDCTDSFRQNTLKNLLGVPPRNATSHNQSRIQNEPPVTQKDRFRSGFLLPSQRFNQSVASVPISEKPSSVHNLVLNRKNVESCANAPRNSSDYESEQEDIMNRSSEITIREQSVYKEDIQSKSKADPRKRCLEGDEVLPNNKRSKLSSPAKKNVKEMPLQKEIHNVKDNKSNEFEFLKPQFPVRKSGNVKVKEKLLAKSAEPLIDTVFCSDNLPKAKASLPHCDPTIQKESTELHEQQSDLASTSDISMRPSFIKRKLYTQKFDVLESKNTSTENLASPTANVYTTIQKEKHKARKLVTNQSCLSRDVREDNNLLDLIHKIVPPDRMNITNVTNKSEIANHSTKNKPDDDKWDITSVITSCNNDDVSDTYTDEEIFNNESSSKQVNNKEKNQSNIKKAVTNEKTPGNEKEVANKAKSTNNKKRESPSKKKSPAKKKKESPSKNKLLNEKKSPSKTKSPCEKIKNWKVFVEKLPNNKAPENLHKKPQLPDNIKPLPERKKPTVADETRDENKTKINNCVKSFWDTDSESDMENVRTAKKVEKENNINHGNLTKKEKPYLNQSSKTLDTTQSKFIWNRNSKPAVTLKSHNFSNQVKAVNVNKSFTKRITENAKEQKNNELPQSKEKQKKSLKAIVEPKPSKKIVLDTYNSTVSDNTQNETVLDTNNKSCAPRAKKSENIKKNEDSTKHKDMPKTQVTGKTKPNTLNRTPEKDISAAVNNANLQRKQVDKKAFRRSPTSPKEFTCCKVPLNKKSKIETISKMNKMALDNYNSTLSDNTLDEIIKNGNKSRALRATRIKNIENSILDDLGTDDSQMLNMTLRSRQRNASIVKGKSDKKTNASQMLNMTLRPKLLNASIVRGRKNEKTTVSTKAEEKARNTSKNSQTKDTQSKPNKTLLTPVKGPNSIAKSSSKRHSPRTNNYKVKSTPVHKRAIKRK